MTDISVFPGNPGSLVEALQWRARFQPDQRAFTFLVDGETVELHITYAELDRQARSIAARLQELAAQGERAVLLYPAGLDYITAFYGCLYAQTIAVPVYPPRQNRSIQRLAAILADAQPTIALTTTQILATLQRRFTDHPELQALHWEATDTLPPDLTSNWQPTEPTRESLAFLQYTSGSTGTPKGVMLSHGNLLHNSLLIQQACGFTSQSRGMSWLPPYHDMGLIGGIIQPIYTGFHLVFMSPVAFLQSPLRWLQAITRYHSTSTAGPNFAFELCINRVTPEQLTALDLSSLSQVLNGAEPINPETLDRFATTFAACGLRKEALQPCYGLAEATLFVTGASGTSPVATQRFDVTALAEDRVLALTTEDQPGKTLVSCGPAPKSQRILIVDPVTFAACEPGRVGEIWIAGPSVTQGYWQRPEETQQTFHAYLASTGEGPFMRTGDLGFLYQGELFITGRLKDLIIIRARNLYPQDIERTARQSHPALSRGSGAAFSLEVAAFAPLARKQEERLVIVQEIERQHQRHDPQEVVNALRQAIVIEHEVEVYAVAFLKAGSIPKTSSGKIQRRACRQGFLDGTLDIVSQWTADTQEAEAAMLESPPHSQAASDIPTGPSAISTRPAREAIIDWLVEQVARQARVPVQLVGGQGAVVRGTSGPRPQREPKIDIQAPFESYGLDSLAAVSISGEMERWLGCRLSPTLIYDYPSIERLATYMASEAPPSSSSAPSAEREAQQTVNEPIAVIGMGCRFPGAGTPEDFWHLLSTGKHAISEAQPDRLAISAQYDPQETTLFRAVRAGFLEQVDLFDARFFGISPREAISMDPQQRLLLEVAWEALENAGLSPERLAGSRTGVFVGISSNDYSRLPGNVTQGHDTYSATGNALSIAANRLSYLLNLRGPSLAVDTACSSSLVALHLACQSLRQGESEVALAGGVNLILSPHITQLFNQAQMMASDGLCKTFDAQADGYVRGEGCGMVVLKRLSAALQDGDPILALIRGSAVNQDGRSNGLTAPNGLAQQAVIQAALHHAGVTPDQIGYIEAHGTGTPLGDPIEVQALGAVLQAGRPPDALCALGSVKTNVGHLEAAAGIVGFIKVVLALQHEMIPPHLHLTKLNPHIPLDALPLHIPTRPYPWPRGAARRLAGVSSFGFGGTNAHMILEEAPLPARAQVSQCERPRHLLPLSAQSEPALRELAGRYIQHMQRTPGVSLADLCFTAGSGRAHFPHRLAVSAASLPQLEESLRAFVAGDRVRGMSVGHQPGRQPPPLAWLFTGQGSQYVGMGRQLYETQPTFQRALEYCAELLQPHLDKPLLSLLYAPSASSALLDETIYTQPALFALEYSLAELWRSWGVQPNMVLGHSVGEYVAACIAGVFSLEDGLKLIAARGRLMQELTQEGAMMNVLADEAQVRRILHPYKHQCAIAAINAPEHIVIAGTSEAIQEVSQRFSEQGIMTQSLNVLRAFHSPCMEPMLDAFEQIARQVQYHIPMMPLISTVTGQALTEAPDSHYWVEHTRQTVNFAAALSTIAASGEHVFMEIGPHPTLLSLGKRCLPEQAHLWLPSLKREQEDWRILLESLGTLYTHGWQIDWMNFERDYSRCRVSLPTYPFERKRYWRESTQPAEHLAGSLPATHASSFETHLPIIIHRGEMDLMEKTLTANSSPGEIAASPTLALGRKAAILSTLRTIVGQLLQVEPAEIEIHASLLELGADSLILIDAIRLVEKTFGLKLSVRLLFEELTTIDALATYIEQHTTPDTMPAAEQPTSATRVAPESQPLEPARAPEVSAHAGANVVGGQGEPTLPGLEGQPAEMALGRVMEQQLSVLAQVMAQQLEVLRGGPASNSQGLIQPSTAPAKDLRLVGGQGEPKREPKRGRPGDEWPAGHSAPIGEQTAVRGPEAKNERETFVAFEGKRSDTFKGLNERQQRHLDALIERYTRRTQRSKQLTQATRAVLADVRGVAGFRFSIKEMLYPIMAERSQGDRIWDVDGNEYIDISMGFGIHLLGHNPPFIREALERQLQHGIPLGPQSLQAGKVAELIHELTGMERVAFMNSGTEAVMTALRLARTATRRQKIALFAGAYHGSFDGVLARMERDGERAYAAPMAPGVPAHMIEDVLVLDYGDARSLETVRAHAHELAAVLAEPVQSRRPDLQPGAFLQELRTITQEAGIALIFDEVITGFRVHPGGAQAWFGVEADIGTYGKIVGGGLPIGVVAGKAAYLDGIDGGMWQYGDASYPQAETTFFAGTFCKHPLAMAAACATLEHLKVQGPALQEELNRRTARLAATLNTFFETERVPIRIVHYGSLFRFAFTGNMDLLFYHLLEKGIYIWEGRNCFLSTAHTDDSLAYLVQAVQESIAEMRAGGFLPDGPSGGGQERRHDLPQRAASPLSTFTPVPASSESNGHGHSGEHRHEHVTLSQAPLTAPLTEAQKQLWVLAQMGTDESSAYNESIALELRGPFRLGSMQQAFQRIVERHEALRTTISPVGDVQYILPSLHIDISVIDLAHAAPAEREAGVADYMREESQRCFDLVHGPLIRVSVVKLAEAQHLLLVVAHHVVVDGWAIGVLLQEASAIYSAICQERSCSLEPPMQFSEYVRWQEQQQCSAERRADETYWLERFATAAPDLELPTDRPRPAIKTYNGARQSCAIDERLYERIKQLSRQQRCTPFMFLFAAYMAYIARISGQRDLVIGIPTAGRPLEKSEHLVGYCVNLTPIRSLVDTQLPWSAHLNSIKKSLLGAYEHQDYPFATLVKKLNPPRDISRSALVNMTFNMDRHIPVQQMFELEGDLLTPALRYTKFDLSLNIIEFNGTLLIDLDYNTDLFEEATIVRMLGHYRSMLQEIIAQPELPLWRLSLLTEAERQDLLLARNATATLYPSAPLARRQFERCYHHCFEEQVARTPQALALQAGDQCVSYQQLDERANQVAAFLHQQGVTRGSVVALCLPRCPEMVVALLGIFKAGGAFLPLDPAFPSERIAYMLQDAQAQIVLTHTSFLPHLPLEGRLGICLDRDWPVIEQYGDGALNSGVGGDDLAYIMYTSGSTGKPKGVLIPHRGLLNYLLWCVTAYGAANGRGAPVQSSIAADAIFPSLFAPLLVGRAVYLMPQERALDALREQLQAEGGFSLIKITPSQLEVLTQELSTQDARGWVGTLVVGAEALRGDILDFWQQNAQGTIVLNEYGPTETVVGCSIYHVPAGQLMRGPVPIGLPIANTQFYVLNERMQPVPVGVPGELYIGGIGVAWGYLNRPEQTASVFVPDPFGSQPGARLYKTGDLVRYLPDAQANIEFIGRKDQQVKIRGYRVELGEIEACLVEHAAVESAVVLARGESGNNRQLTAYILPQASMAAEACAAILREYLHSRLPDYMVPAAFVLVERWPLTATGKIDLRALPTPERSSYELPDIFTAPRTITEQELARIWQQVLGVPQVGIYDNFFEAGGDSILAIQVIARAAQAGLRLSAKDLFIHQTIVELAALADEVQPEPGHVAEQGPVLGPVPLTPIQHWFFSQEQPEPHHYNQSVLLEARRPLDPAHLARALNEVITHHDALRARFTRDERGWRQVNAPLGEPVEIMSIDLAHLSSPPALSEAIETAASAVQASLNLESGPLLRVALFLCGPSQPQRLLIAVHHLVIDGISWRILLEDLHTVYQQVSSGQPALLPSKTSSFQQWAHGLQDYAQSTALREELTYWQHMAGFTAPSLSVEENSGEHTVSSARTITVALSEAETQALLQQVPAAYHTQVNDILLTALAKAVEDWTGSANLLLALEGHGREEIIEGLNLSRTVGWFTSLFPVYVSVEGAEDTASAIKQVKEQLRRVPQRGSGYGVLRYLADDRQVRDSVRAIPEPQISFNYLGQFGLLESEASLFTLARETAGQSESPHHLRPYLLEINGRVTGGCLQVAWTYSTARHSTATITKLAESYLAHVRELIRHCLLPESGGYTPSDFPQARLSQEQLDQLSMGRGDIADIYPLSPMQQGMLFHSLYDPTFDMYICQGSWNIQGHLQRAAFAQAWQHVIRQHAILRTAFAWRELEHPLQVVFQDVQLPIAYLDWSPFSDAEQAERLEVLLAEDRTQGFSLEQAPLMRLTLIHLGQERHQLLWSYHHLLLDGWSMPLVLKDVLTCYQAACHEQPAVLPSRRPYKAYIAWLARQDLAAAETFWRQELQGLRSGTSLGVERAHAPVEDAPRERYAEILWRLPASLQAELQRLAQRYKVTINTVLQGAWALLLSRYSGEKEVVFGVTVSGRSEMLAGVESMVGLFINTLPMRVPVPNEARVETWLQGMQAHQAEAYTYAYTPLWHIQRWSESGGQQPLFQSLFVFENYPLNISLQELEGLVVENAVQNEQTNYPLSLIVLPDAGMLCKLGYDARLFEEATIQRMLEHYQTILQGMTEQPELPLGQLPLLSEAEYQRVVYAWNATQCAYAEDELSLCTLFEKQVERTPDAPAAMFKGQRLTYRDLNARANQCAHYLHSQGIQPGVRIGICLERSLDMLVGLVAILKVGGIYVPLDPAYPAERLAFMLEDAQLAALITRHELVERLPAHEARVICIDRDWPAMTQESQENPAHLARGEDGLYMLYTSGSTGKPKGIVGTQRATLNRFRWMWQSYPFAPGEVCCQKTTLNFVDAVWEIFGPLLQGIPLVIIPDQAVKDLAQFLSTLAQYRVTRIVLVPSLLRVLLQSEEDLQQCLADLKYWVCSGEALPLELARSFQQRVPQGTLINLYGSTEVAADATFYEVRSSAPLTRRQDELRSSVPIGRPIANTQVYLLDEAMRPVPIGVAGELHIGGVCLARGYFKRPELTRAKFVPDPFSREPGARLYKTGDWARYLPDGTLEYLGRRDQQVKVRGIRIELGEIEAVLSEHPAIDEAVVVVRVDVPGDQRLVAYVVLHDAQSITASDLQRHLHKKVPASMAPGAFVFLDSLPLMPNGKVDRQALPDLTYAWSAPRTTFVAPRTPIEQTLADVWQQVLNLPQVSIYDNFFDVGGDSIRAILLASRIQSLFLIDLSLRDLFEAETATIASLAEYIERARQDVQAQEEQIAQLLEQVKDLSDEEANVLLSHVADA